MYDGWNGKFQKQWPLTHSAFIICTIVLVWQLKPSEADSVWVSVTPAPDCLLYKCKWQYYITLVCTVYHGVHTMSNHVVLALFVSVHHVLWNLWAVSMSAAESRRLIPPHQQNHCHYCSLNTTYFNFTTCCVMGGKWTHGWLCLQEELGGHKFIGPPPFALSCLPPHISLPELRQAVKTTGVKRERNLLCISNKVATQSSVQHFPTASTEHKTNADKLSETNTLGYWTQQFDHK